MGKLYVVGTPIGNLGDMSPRAIKTLEEVDFIAVEDTRVTIKLLNHFNIKTPMITYQKYIEYERSKEIVEKLLSGQSAAVVTDAGMPCISDPGEELVRQCAQAGVPVEVVPGPSALISALAVSGLSVSRFCFEGFLSVKHNSRVDRLREIAKEKRTMIFYEAPHKLRTTLTDMLEVLGDRNIVLVRELTKIHESVFRGKISEALKGFETEPPRGEYVLITEGAPEEKNDKDPFEEAVELARKMTKEGKPASVAAREAAKLTGRTKGEIYKELIK